MNWKALNRNKNKKCKISETRKFYFYTENLLFHIIHNNMKFCNLYKLTLIFREKKIKIIRLDILPLA